MNANIIGILVIVVILLVLVLAVGIGIYAAYRKVHDTVRTYSRAIFGTDNPVDGIQKAEMENASRPKSVASATALYLPQITKDFPEFHYDEMKSRAENVLISYLRGIDAGNPSLLTEGMEELRESLRQRIQMLQNRECREHFERIRVHRTEINQYRKGKGRCSVVLQSAVESIHYVEQGGRIVEGRRELKEQARYNVEVVYIQDRDTVENLGDSGLGLNCPNCGAPLPGLGAKTCIYCDTPVVEFNIRIWNFSSVKKV
ncbi:MAG: zinc ribbon domain-containing protein [Muribaculum sp.]|nr:zinc ribbon domain-containing protein [Muribaculum sp.]